MSYNLAIRGPVATCDAATSEIESIQSTLLKLVHLYNATGNLAFVREMNELAKRKSGRQADLETLDDEESHALIHLLITGTDTISPQEAREIARAFNRLWLPHANGENAFQVDGLTIFELSTGIREGATEGLVIEQGLYRAFIINFYTLREGRASVDEDEVHIKDEGNDDTGRSDEELRAIEELRAYEEERDADIRMAYRLAVRAVTDKSPEPLIPFDSGNLTASMATVMHMSGRRVTIFIKIIEACLENKASGFNREDLHDPVLGLWHMRQKLSELNHLVKKKNSSEDPVQYDPLYFAGIMRTCIEFLKSERDLWDSIIVDESEEEVDNEEAPKSRATRRMR